VDGFGGPTLTSPVFLEQNRPASGDVQAAMSQKYLLPCPSCETRHVVDTTKLGLPFECQCGTTLEVRTLRDLRALEPVEAERPDTPSWHIGSGLVLLGLIIALWGLGAAGLTWYRYQAPPIELPEERLLEDSMRLTWEDSLTLWDQLRGTPLEAPLNNYELSWINAHEARDRFIKTGRTWITIWSVLAGSGVVIACVGLLIPRR
jgi:hypothetical protein